MRNRLNKDSIDLGVIRKLEKGKYEEFTRNDEKVGVTVWMDSGPVIMASNFDPGGKGLKWMNYGK